MQKKIISNVIWVLNNFLTMQCYRKMCNNLYWKKLTPGSVSYKTRLWIIIISALSAVWLAFFFDPTDPTSSISFSLMIALLARTFRKLDFSVHALFNGLGKIMFRIRNQATHRILDSDNIFLWRSRETYLLSSSFLI